MKKILTSVGLVAVGVSSLQGAYAPDLTPMEAAKPWSVSAALRGFYDDNYTTLPSHSHDADAATADESFGYEFTPSVSLNLPLDQTFIGASYEYSVKYYEARPDDKYDQNHKFDARLDHAFSERYKIKVDDSFVISQEPEILTTVGAVDSPLRTEGDNIRNLGSIRFTAQMTELLALELAYANTFYDYEQDSGEIQDDPVLNVNNPDGIDSRSGLLDRIEHRPTVDLRWQVMPDTIAILGYSFGMVDFTGDEEITNPDEDPNDTIFDTDDDRVSSDFRNNRSHRVYVGADHRFNAQLSASVRVGGEYTDFYNEGDDSVSPYADANVTYQYNRGNSIQVGVTHARNQTDVNSLDQETTVLYGSITHKITPNLIGSLLVQGQHSKFEGGPSDGDTENFFISGLNLSYHFNPHLLAEAGYNFDRLDSDLSGRSFSRNRVYVGVRATY